MKYIKTFFNKCFIDQRIVISSEKSVRTIKFTKKAQIFIFSIFIFVLLAFAFFFVFGVKLYGTIDKKQRKIDQMRQDGQVTKVEVAKMIIHMEKINEYFEKISRKTISDDDVKNIDDNNNKNENQNPEQDQQQQQNDDENDIITPQKNTKNNDKKDINKKREELLNPSESRVPLNLAYNNDNFDNYTIQDLNKILRSKIAYWYAMINTRYAYIQDVLLKLDLLNCKSSSWLSKALSKAEYVIDAIGISSNATESQIFEKMKTRICNSGHIQNAATSYKVKNHMQATDDDFIPSMIKLEGLIMEIPLGNPLKNGKFSSPFGYRIDPVHKKMAKHEGMDLVLSYGAKIFSTAYGTVIKSGWHNGYGWSIDVAHGHGITTRYAHMSHIDARLGQKVYPGTLIGRQGNSGKSTGSHLHYEIRINNLAINPKRFIVQHR